MIKLYSLLWSAIKLNFLNAAWNFERLQNIGFLCAIINILKKIYNGNKEGFLKAIKRHINFFNTHIFFSSAVLGVVSRLEETIPNENLDYKDKEIENTKMGIMGPLAAIGDSLFWSGIKPLSLFLGASIVLLTGINIISSLWAIIISLFLYNIPRTIIKYYLLIKSYYEYKELFLMIQKAKFQGIMKSIKIIGMCLLGGVMGVFLNSTIQKTFSFVKTRFIDNILFLIAFTCFVAMLKRKTSVSHIFIAIIIFSILVSYILI